MRHLLIISSLFVGLALAPLVGANDDKGKEGEVIIKEQAWPDLKDIPAISANYLENAFGSKDYQVIFRGDFDKDGTEETIAVFPKNRILEDIHKAPPPPTLIYRNIVTKVRIFRVKDPYWRKLLGFSPKVESLLEIREGGVVVAEGRRLRIFDQPGDDPPTAWMFRFFPGLKEVFPYGTTGMGLDLTPLWIPKQKGADPVLITWSTKEKRFVEATF